MPIIAGPDKSKPKGVAAVIVDAMGKEKAEPSPDSDGPFLGKQLIAAIDGKDENRVYAAFKALFKHCEMEPHEEYGEENEGE
jgi:hypothetical protein